MTEKTEAQTQENKETIENNATIENKDGNITIIEKNIHRTNLRRLIDTLYLFVPIALTFAGCFLAEPLWTAITKKDEVPELFRFGCAAVIFLLAATFVFIKTRKINPIMKIGIFSSKD